MSCKYCKGRFHFEKAYLSFNFFETCRTFKNENKDNRLCCSSRAFFDENFVLTLFERERFIFLKQVDKLSAEVVS
jgi:hypothetical protein